MGKPMLPDEFRQLVAEEDARIEAAAEIELGKIKPNPWLDRNRDMARLLIKLGIAAGFTLGCQRAGAMIREAARRPPATTEPQNATT